MRDGCCGNGVCEAGENGNTCSQDCTFALSTPTCSSCWVPYGAQFDVQATINDIDISKILFGIYQGNTNFKLYTAAGSYNNAEAGDWTLIASGSLVTSSEFYSALIHMKHKLITFIDLLLNPSCRLGNYCCWHWRHYRTCWIHAFLLHNCYWRLDSCRRQQHRSRFGWKFIAPKPHSDIMG